MPHSAPLRKSSSCAGAAALELAGCRLYGRPPPGHFRENPNRLNDKPGKPCARFIKSLPPRPGARPNGRASRGSSDDLRDGYIHFSTASQVAETARKHYFGQTGLFLVAVDADALGDALRWEPSRNDELFPHLYGELDLGAVTAVLDMRARSDGTHDIPELIP